MLLIEDSITTQKAVTVVFDGDDLDIIAANGATEGLQKLQTLVPDIILADTSLPGIDGFRLCEMIRETKNMRHVPVLLLTSNFAIYDKAKGDRVGVTEHLAKPFEPHALRHLVWRLMTSTSPTAAPLDPSPIHSTDPPAWPTERLETTALQWQDILESFEERQRTAHETAEREEAPAPEAVSVADVPDNMIHQSPGNYLIRMIRETLDTHLGMML
jgi:CheY-like chemotaxis protein